MMKAKDIDVQELRKRVSYDPEEGTFTWLPTGCSIFDARYAGRPAMNSICSLGYRKGVIMGVSIRAHRVAWAIHFGQWPDGVIDHINQDRADNRIANLRLTDQQGNARNRKLNADNTSGYPGVYWSKSKKRWQAMIKVDGRNVHLGAHNEKAEAVAARHQAEVYFGFSRAWATTEAARSANGRTGSARSIRLRPIALR